MFYSHLVVSQSAGSPGALESVLWRGVCVCVIVMSTVRVIAFWKKGVFPRDMGKEAMDPECKNSSETEQHVSLVPSLVASSSPVPLAALLWAGMWAGLPRGGQQRLGSSGAPCRRK